MDGEAKKLLRMSLPYGVALQHGTRLIVDQGQPATSPFVTAFPGNGYSAKSFAVSTLGVITSPFAKIPARALADGTFTFADWLFVCRTPS